MKWSSMWRRLSLCLARFQRPVEAILRILLFIAMMGIWNAWMPRPLARFSKNTFPENWRPVFSQLVCLKAAPFFLVSAFKACPSKQVVHLPTWWHHAHCDLLEQSCHRCWGAFSVSARRRSWRLLSTHLFAASRHWWMNSPDSWGELYQVLYRLGIHEIYACCAML